MVSIGRALSSLDSAPPIVLATVFTRVVTHTCVEVEARLAFSFSFNVRGTISSEEKGEMNCLATMQGSADSVRLVRAPRSISDTTEDHQEHQRHTARLRRLKMDKPPATETESRAAQAIGLLHEHDGTDTPRSPHTSLTSLARSLSKSSVLDVRSSLVLYVFLPPLATRVDVSCSCGH